MATETATLAGGCFWCLDAVFRDLQGVIRCECGYAGGQVANPTYEQVCGKRTGHAEVVQVEFDPAILSYEDLLRIFFTIHDPTTKDRQGADAGPQYRSAIFTHSPGQAAAARQVIAEVQPVWEAPIVTEVVPLDRFWPGEKEHQDYFRRNPGAGYCRAVVGPKVAKFRKQFAHRLAAVSKGRPPFGGSGQSPAFLP